MAIKHRGAGDPHDIVSGSSAKGVAVNYMQKTTAAKLCFTFVIGLGLFGIPLALAQVRTLAMALVALLFYFGFKWRNG